jgi:hypothetical protein
MAAVYVLKCMKGTSYQFVMEGEIPVILFMANSVRKNENIIWITLRLIAWSPRLALVTH